MRVGNQEVQDYRMKTPVLDVEYSLMNCLSERLQNTPKPLQTTAIALCYQPRTRL